MTAPVVGMAATLRNGSFNAARVTAPQPAAASRNCDPWYPHNRFRPPPPDLDCDEVNDTDFRVRPPDPDEFDRDHDGIGCESTD